MSSGVLEWMLSSMLKLNPDQTEFIIFGSCSVQAIRFSPPCQSFGKFIYQSVIVKNFGVLFDANFSKIHFGHSFAFDTPTVWNDLPEHVCSALILSLGKGFSTLAQNWHLHGIDLAMSMEL